MRIGLWLSHKGVWGTELGLLFLCLLCLGAPISILPQARNWYDMATTPSRTGTHQDLGPPWLSCEQVRALGLAAAQTGHVLCYPWFSHQLLLMMTPAAVRFLGSSTGPLRAWVVALAFT